MRANKNDITIEEQLLIEELYFDLKSLNPELAQRTLRYAIIYLEKFNNKESLNDTKPVSNHLQTSNKINKFNTNKAIKKCKQHKSSSKS